MTFNIEDIRTEDILDPDHSRLKRIAGIIQQLRPDILLLNEVAYDEGGQNARVFVENFLSVAQNNSLQPVYYQTFMAPSNTGLSSGLDLDNDGEVVTVVPDLPPPNEDGSPGPQTDAGRAYGNDAWGFGTFPGQYAMALLVRNEFEILFDQVRTFQLLPWSDMRNALRPVNPETGAFWHSEEEWAQVRLSSKNHWDVPVRLPDGHLVHVLASHPTPPAFDGPEARNKRRNHDEIRFWSDYLAGASYIVDDNGQTGGLDPEASFVILGDLNADPDEGSSFQNPAQTFLLDNPRINNILTPVYEGVYTVDTTLSQDDTALWGLRVDYVLPSSDLQIEASGIWRYAKQPFPSDHFPVWVDLRVPPHPTVE